MPKLSILKNSLRFRLGLMAAVLVFGSVPLVTGSGWSLGIQGDCYNTRPKGASWVNWSGYYPLSWGESKHYLQWQNPATLQWEIKAYGNSGMVYGMANTALANSSAGYRAGVWAVGASYAANFYPLPPRDTYTFTC